MGDRFDDRESWEHRPDDGEFVEELFKQHHSELERYISRSVHSPQLADDILQETFLAAWVSRADLPGVHDFRAWLFGIAHNRVLMYSRGSRRREVAQERFRRASRTSAPINEIDGYAIRDLIARTLSPGEREILVLYYLHGFHSQEIGELLGCSEFSVRKQLQRSRGKLGSAHRRAS